MENESQRLMHRQPRRSSARHRMRPAFVLAATGTLGDQLPLLALAEALLASGLRCHVLGTTAGVEIARRRGVPFTAVVRSNPNNLASVEENFANYVFPSYRPTFEFFEAEVRRGAPLVVVNLTAASASTLLAEWHGLPLCRLFLSPFEANLADTSRWVDDSPVGGLLGSVVRRFRKREPAPPTHPFVLRGINRFRAALRRPVLRNLAQLDALVVHRIGLFPEWYGAGARRTLGGPELVGFPLPAPRTQLPTPLCQWIERHGAPLVFTPGTGVRDVAAFFAAAERCCEALGRPGILLSKTFSDRPFDASRRIVHLDYVDLGALLPRSCLLTHHGGIGTTARALEAGIPQVVSPQIFDQPDNARSVERLGVGVMLPRAELCGDVLAQQARRLLECDSFRRSAAELAQRLLAQNGAEAASKSLIRQFDTPSHSALA
jgi:rhamnosyltransferase subunit B